MIKKFLAVLCCVLSVGFFAFIVSKAVYIEKNFRVQSEDLIKIKNMSPVENLISNIQSSDLKSAAEIFNQDDFKSSCDENLYRYLHNFFALFDENNSEEFGIVDFNYFINKSNIVQKYFEDTNYSEINAFRISEQIPYFIVKICQQTKKSRKETWLFSFCESYKNHFMKFDSISKETADVVCLYFNLKYKTTKDESDLLKSEMNEISTIQKRYKNELGENGTYIKQSQYLQNIFNFLEKKSNSLIDRLSKLLTFLRRFKNCPEYFFDTAI